MKATVRGNGSNYDTHNQPHVSSATGRLFKLCSTACSATVRKGHGSKTIIELL